MKVAVIGAGVVGASIAWRLSEQGAEVLLIDSAQPGWRPIP
jgi:glycine/D-amino acid oxidase-like deaminating enzyme